jgi:hypothetical protein
MLCRHAAAVLLLLLGCAGHAFAQMVQYIDSRGNLSFYYRPEVERSPRSIGNSRSSAEREKHLSALIETIAREHGVDPALVRAVIRVESDFHPSAVSPAGAKGLMQLMPATAAHYGVQDIFDVEQNIRGGVRFLRHLKERYGDSLRLVLAAYNAGETAVSRAGGDVPPFAETRQYVVDVLHHYQTRGGSGEPMVMRASYRAPAPAAAGTPSAPAAAGKPAAKPAAPAPAAPSRPLRIYKDSRGIIHVTNLP